MKADGSNLTQLTNEKADHAIGTKYGHTPEPWSPDGKKIVYSQRFSKEDTNLLYVMDADGSNKIALTSEPGMYTFLGWSPDGKKIVYQDQQFEGRIRIVDDNGTNYIDGPFFEGDKSRRYSQIHWETPDQFIAIGSNSEQSMWGPWNITRFFTTGDSTNYNGSNPILAASNSPIVAVFDKTYVVEDQNSLTWFAYDSAPIPLSPWNFSQLCNTTDPLKEETFHFLSPDKQHDFVGLLCPEGNSYFFLMSIDGSEIHQLSEPLAQPLQVNALEWSPDGKFLIATILNINNESTELYSFDIEKMLKDPSTKPIQLTTDGAMKYGAIWQPTP
jgi:dipeptidyl aminopeptidase/acylaminoacyl peptidase